MNWRKLHVFERPEFNQASTSEVKSVRILFRFYIMSPWISFVITVVCCNHKSYATYLLCDPAPIILKYMYNTIYQRYWLFWRIASCNKHNFFSFRNHSELQDDSTEERTDIVELLEAIAYLICIDEPVRPESFHKILSSRGIPAKILRLADTDRDGEVSVEEMMSFIMVITNPR